MPANTSADTPTAQQYSSKSNGRMVMRSTYPTGNDEIPLNSVPSMDPENTYEKRPSSTRAFMRVTISGNS